MILALLIFCGLPALLLVACCAIGKRARLTDCQPRRRLTNSPVFRFQLTRGVLTRCGKRAVFLN